MLTQERLKRLFHYCPSSGVFTRLVSTSNRVKVGSVSGYKKMNGYSYIYVDRKEYSVHWLSWLYVYGEWPKNQIDHINHIKTDNRIENLRDVTCGENQKNAPLQKTNTSGITGVVMCNSYGAWKAQIKVNRKTIYLGRHLDKFEAICARKSAEHKYGFHENHGVK